MVDNEKLNETIMKTIEEGDGELRYSFVVYVEEDKLKLTANVHKGELHTSMEMLERPKSDLLKRVEKVEQ